MFSKESGTKADATVSNTYQISYQISYLIHTENAEAATVGVLYKAPILRNF